MNYLICSGYRVSKCKNENKQTWSVVEAMKQRSLKLAPIKWKYTPLMDTRSYMVKNRGPFQTNRAGVRAFDVQPPEPLELWKSGPLIPTL